MLSYIFDKTAEVQLDRHMHIFAGKMLPILVKMKGVSSEYRWFL